jgi:DNA-binding MarR family transcriptional regulator
MKTSGSPVDEIVQNCLAVRVRLIGRAVTAVYERAVTSHGMTIAQVSLMAVLGKVGPCPPSRLGEVLQLERSTVSRNLDILLRNGWVQADSSDAKGVREVSLTSAGRHKLESVMPAWRTAQAKAARLLGDAGVKTVRTVADTLWGNAEAR